MSIKKTALALAMTAGAIGVTLDAQPVSRPSIGQRLEGPWIVSFSVDIAPGVTAPPQFTLSTFGPGGETMSIGPSQAPPIPPVLTLGKEATSAVGEWLRIGDRQFVYTIVNLLSTNGAVGGTQTTRVTLTLSEAGDTFIGMARAEFADLDGKVVVAGTAAVKGTRIAVEVISPAAQ